MSWWPIEKKVLTLERRRASAAIAKREATVVEALGPFWQQLEVRLQAGNAWRLPGEDFFVYVVRSLGLDGDRVREPADGPDQDELLEAIRRQFPDLDSIWQRATEAISGSPRPGELDRTA